MKKYLLLTTATLIGAVLLAGCGSSSSGSGSSSTPSMSGMSGMSSSTPSSSSSSTGSSSSSSSSTGSSSTTPSPAKLGKPVKLVKNKAYALGQAVLVPIGAVGAKKTTPVAIALTSVKNAPASMFQGLPKGLDKNHVYEVTLTYSDKGKAAVKQPSLGFSTNGIDATGKASTHLGVVGSTSSCSDPDPASILPGKTYSSCVYLATKNAKALAKVKLLANTGGGQTAVLWKVG